MTVFKSTKCVSVLIATICLLTGLSCSDSEPSDSVSPDGCFEFLITHDSDYRCFTQYDYKLLASCITDNRDNIEDIEIRWDFDNDGVFDTEYSNEKEVLFSPDFDLLDNTTVVMECKDKSGNVSSTSKLLNFDELPRKPDLVAGELMITNSDELDIASVKAGVTFYIKINQSCFGDFRDPGYSTTVSLNNVIIQSGFGGCNGNLSCSSSATPYTINEPGTYQFFFVLDSSGAYPETDETNNVSSVKTLVVVP